MKHSPQFLALVNDAKKRVKETTVDEIKKRLERGDSFILIDVREESEFAKDHLPGARHMGKGTIERDIETAIPDTKSCFTAAAGSAAPWPPTIFRKWVTQT
jgi:hypothetical protein